MPELSRQDCAAMVVGGPTAVRPRDPEGAVAWPG